MKAKLANLRALANRKVAIASTAVAGVLTTGVANAALPEAIGTQMQQIQSDGLELADLVWPVVITLFGALVLFKLFKRFGNQI